jgi:hypothetical protein
VVRLFASLQLQWKDGSRPLPSRRFHQSRVRALPDECRDTDHRAVGSVGEERDPRIAAEIAGRQRARFAASSLAATRPSVAASRPRPKRGPRNTARQSGTPGCKSRRRWCSEHQDRLSFRSGRRDSNPRRLPWQEGTTAFPVVTRRYKIAKSQQPALPGRSTRFAEVVLLVVLCDVEHHCDGLRPARRACIAPELGVSCPPSVAPGAGVISTAGCDGITEREGSS